MSRYAYMIGSSEFEADSGIQPLVGPPNDIAQLSTHLSDPVKGDYTVTPFLNKLWGKIKKDLYSSLRTHDADDTILVYFSGHGLIDNDDGKLYLSSPESDAENVAGTSLLAAELLDRIRRSPASKCIFILDCCYSGAVSSIGERSAEADQASRNLETISSGSGVTVITASTETQTAKDLDTEQVGLFTKFLIEGLKTGKADRDRNGEITARELFDYASARTKETTKNRQEPKIIEEVTGHFAVASSGLTSYTELLEEISKRLHNEYNNGNIRGEEVDFVKETFQFPERHANSFIDSMEIYTNKYVDNLINIATFAHHIRVLREHYSIGESIEPPAQNADAPPQDINSQSERRSIDPLHDDTGRDYTKGIEIKRGIVIDVIISILLILATSLLIGSIDSTDPGYAVFSGWAATFISGIFFCIRRHRGMSALGASIVLAIPGIIIIIISTGMSPNNIGDMAFSLISSLVFIIGWSLCLLVMNVKNRLITHG